MASPTLAPRPQLLTYPDSLGGDLHALADLLDGPLAGCVRGVHVLPPVPSSGDRGFAPLTYHEIDPRFGSWSDLERIAARHDLVLDLMVNHLSRRSPEFLDVERRGRGSPHADLFLTLDKVWPGGEPSKADLAGIVVRKRGGPVSRFVVEETGETEHVWTSFGSAERWEQVDLDVSSMAGRAFLSDALATFAAHGVRVVRLDAVGYVVKRSGTTCFMVEPEVGEFLAWIASVADGLGLVVLPEVHDRWATHERLSAAGFWTYDFVLPALVLHAFETGDARRLAAHLAASPRRVFTTLDTHDGIPVRPDLDGILEPSEMRELAEAVVARGGNVSRLLAGVGPDGVDVHQLNVTYRSAMADDRRYLAARAIQLFARGIPQVHYVGLLAGENDRAAVERTGDGRAINRHDFTPAEIDRALRDPLVTAILDLIRLRNTHPAFDGDLAVETIGAGGVRLAWSRGAERCSLEVDLASGAYEVRQAAGER